MPFSRLNANPAYILMAGQQPRYRTGHSHLLSLETDRTGLIANHFIDIFCKTGISDCPSSSAYLHYIFQATPAHTLLIFTPTKYVLLIGAFSKIG